MEKMLILLGMAVVPLAEFIWAIIKHIYKIIRLIWGKRRKRVPIFWRELRMGIKRSLGGAITALIVIGLLYVWLYYDTQNTNNQNEAWNREFIDIMNKNNAALINTIQQDKERNNQQIQELINRIDKILEQNAKILTQLEATVE